MPLMPKPLSGVWSPSAPGMNNAAPPSTSDTRRVNGPTMPECRRALALRIVGCTAKLPKVATVRSGVVVVVSFFLPGASVVVVEDGTNARSQAIS